MPTSLSTAEENYLKAIFKISQRDGTPVSNAAISAEMNTAAPSVTDMIGRLSQKQLVHYQKRKGVSLSDLGRATATHLVRKHRLWETFLVDKLAFNWDEVHELAEQLEHIQSLELINRLDNYLGNPLFDPHGDPIPDARGHITERQLIPLSMLPEHTPSVVTGVRDHTPDFLQYLQRTGLMLGTRLSVLERFSYDNSLHVALDGGKSSSCRTRLRNIYWCRCEIAQPILSNCSNSQARSVSGLVFSISRRSSSRLLLS
ncbi:MAG: metal-dependent transcriptional regulator [Saprospiraceae bacterium]